MKFLKYISIFIPLCLLAQKDACSKWKSQGIQSVQLEDIGNNSRSDTMDILSYDINLDLGEYQSQLLKASCIVEFQSKIVGQDVLALDLFGLTVDSVLFNSQSLSYSHINQRLEISFPSTLNLVDTFRVEVFYQGTPVVDASGFGGFDFSSNYAYNLGVAFQYEPHNFGRSWFPCFDNFVERSKYIYRVLTTGGRTSYANGLLIEEQLLGGDSIYRVWKSDLEIPTYLASVATAAYKEVTDSLLSTSGNYVPVVLAALENDTADLKNSFIHLDEAFHFFEDKFGMYRWEKVGYSVTPVGAMEHPGNIAYPAGLVTGTTAGEEIMAHELAHHWFGNLITCNEAKEMWINEGLAEYLSYLFMENVYGNDKYMEIIRENHVEMLDKAHISDGGYQVLADMPLNVTYGKHTYNKGADMMHTLRSIMGETSFYDGLTGVLDSFAFSDISSEEFRDHLIGQGYDVNDFFENVIFQTGWAQFDIVDMDWNSSVSSVDLHIEQKLKEATSWYENIPLTISFRSAQGELFEAAIVVGGEETILTLTLPWEPTLAYLNADDAISLASIGEDFHLKENIQEQVEVDLAKVDLALVGIEDSTFVRVEHHWVAPEAQVNDLKYIISSDRYWTFRIADDSKVDLAGIFRYKGALTGSLDEGLMDNITSDFNEERMVLLYRADADQEWEAFSDQNLVPNTLTNKSGRIEANHLKAGEYCFGLKLWPIGVTEFSEIKRMSIFPNPTGGKIQITIDPNLKVKGLTIFTSEGKTIVDYFKDIDHNQLIMLPDSGLYHIIMTDSKGRIYREKVVVE